MIHILDLRRRRWLAVVAAIALLLAIMIVSPAHADDDDDDKDGKGSSQPAISADQAKRINAALATIKEAQGDIDAAQAKINAANVEIGLALADKPPATDPTPDLTPAPTDLATGSPDPGDSPSPGSSPSPSASASPSARRSVAPDPNASAKPTASARPSPTKKAVVPPAKTPTNHVEKLLVITLENHSQKTTLKKMPYLKSLGQKYAVANSYFGTDHPSLPNYIVTAGGATRGINGNVSPESHEVDGPSVMGLVISHGGTAKAYAEGMTQNCQLTEEGSYRPKHNAWPYFIDERGYCTMYNVPASELLKDARANQLPQVGLYSPGMCNDGHDCPLSTVDKHLRKVLPTIFASDDFKSGKLAVAVTFDEDDKQNHNHVYFGLFQASLHGVEVNQKLDHRALSGALSRTGGVDLLYGAKGAPDLLKAFHLTPRPS